MYCDFTHQNVVLDTTVVVSDTARHPPHGWDLQQTSQSDRAGLTWSPPWRLSTCSWRHHGRQLCREEVGEICRRGTRLQPHLTVAHLARSTGLSTRPTEDSRAPDMHRHTSSLQVSGMTAVMLGEDRPRSVGISGLSSIPASLLTPLALLLIVLAQTHHCPQQVGHVPPGHVGNEIVWYDINM